MYAVFKSGGKQYRVSQGQRLTVERLGVEPGHVVAFESVLMVGDGGGTTIGAPHVAGATVAARVVEQTRGPKIRILKRKRRKHYRRRAGHRQDLTLLEITEILTGGAKPDMTAAPVEAPVEEVAAEEPAVEQAPAEEAPAEAAAVEEAEAAVETPAAAAAEAVDEAEPNRLDAPDGEPDDLKKISGVGPKLEGLLHELGFFHYRQIAAWTPAEVAWVDNRLQFKGRIERDDWISQAAALEAAKSEE